jgi:hypothetical protein
MHRLLINFDGVYVGTPTILVFFQFRSFGNFVASFEIIP